MSDIFISYSSKDRDRALSLTERLRSAGYSCWIDQSGIDAATRWSSGIAEALSGCKAIFMLLSTSSLASENVTKELNLAAEWKKKIVPIVLEEVALTKDFAYHLSGIQHISIDNTEGIVKTLTRLGIKTGASPSEVESAKPVTQTEKSITPAISFEVASRALEEKICLAVLPFDDLSPTRDNEWFADGMMDELINTLGSLEKLHVPGRNDVIYYKKNRPKTKEIADDLNVRYLVEGSVRKAGEKIRIHAMLTDAKEHRQLWSENYDGTFDDIFVFQEQTAQAITQALQLRLTPEEKKKIDKKPTENAGAYELYLKAGDYVSRNTKADFDRALSFFEDAVQIAPKFSAAYAGIANTSQVIYRLHSRKPELLEKAKAAAKKIREVEGETSLYFWVVSRLAFSSDDAEEALLLAKQSVELDPNFAPGYGALAFAYKRLGNLTEEVRAREEYVRLCKNDTSAYFNLLIALDELGDKERLRTPAEQAIPVFERHIRLNPDDFNARLNFANILRYAGRQSEALKIAEELQEIQSLDGHSLYTLACLNLNCKSHERGMEILQRATASGYRNIENFLHDPNLDPLREREEFKQIMKQMSEA